MPKIIETPFGQLDVEAKRTKIKLTSTPYNTDLKVEWEGIEYLHFKEKEARLLWRISHFQTLDGERIVDPVLTSKVVYSDINNNNRVTNDGLMVTQERYPEVVTTDTEGVETRDNSAYETALANSYPEFDFWFGAIREKPITFITDAAMQILISENKFTL